MCEAEVKKSASLIVMPIYILLRGFIVQFTVSAPDEYIYEHIFLCIIYTRISGDSSDEHGGGSYTNPTSRGQSSAASTARHQAAASSGYVASKTTSPGSTTFSRLFLRR
jgi:hypothetical protein